ncbi:L-type lectin-domain containing receptor kinase IX.1-like [Argentina anserina]|uniref:L-type lectin-domain containing receptor kinase IX.1-like n=1 Tax=Argentina anserina TaxID=57926 RepID=UPI00217669B4|nr:L-type lectin-domain containing receptor kinase IX.1-like [Potentilla anserina]
MCITISFKETTFRFFILTNFLSHLVNPLSFSISQFNPDTENILYEGDATPRNGNVELTPVHEMLRVARCSYTKPFHLWNHATQSVAHFSTEFTFRIDTRGNDNYSDGFAIFLAPVGYPIPPNSAGSVLGLFNSTTALSRNQIVSIEFDTFKNAWDPPAPHVGININNISSAVTSNWNFNSTKVAKARIAYNATTKILSVHWTDEDTPGPSSATLSYHVEFPDILPEWVMIGFSAATGRSTENHIIYSWKFNSQSDFDELSTSGKWKTFWIMVTIAIPSFILVVGVALCRLLVNRQIIKNTKGHEYYLNAAVPSITRDLERLALPRRFAYRELVAATIGFANDRRLGQGGSGQVYRGVIPELGCVVAVKRIFAESEHYEKIFVNEVKIISSLIHKNLVQFIGWCHEQGECLLVYAYMPNSSLDTHLFGSRTTLQWDFRYKIAVGLASALHYLHEDAEQCVLHRDIKSANILLDNDFSTKLGDFGIAKLVDPRLRTKTTGVAGTFGYMAPEYAFHGRASKESDMFSFGVVALEIACGRQTYQDGDYHMPLFEWVWQLYLAGHVLKATDDRLGVKYDQKEMECLLIVGLWCTHLNSKERPKAGQVMKVLLHEAPLPQLQHNRQTHYHSQYAE